MDPAAQWIIKLALTPLLVALATVVARRQGHRVGGLIVGLPVMTAPVALFLALEQGKDFALAAIPGILMGVAGVAAYTTTFAAASRALGPLASMSLAAAAFLAMSLGLDSIDAGLLPMAIAAALAIAMALSLIPRGHRPKAGRSPPAWDVPLRMALTALLIAGVTLLARELGPRLSGIAGTFPIITTVLSAFTLHRDGRPATLELLRGLQLSQASFCAFFLVLGLALPAMGIAAAFLLSTLAALLSSAIAISLQPASLREAAVEGNR